MTRPVLSSSLLTKDADIRASLLNEVWLLTQKNDFVRDSYKDCPLDELKETVAELKTISRMTPKERLVDRWNSESATLTLLD